MSNLAPEPEFEQAYKGWLNTVRIWPSHNADTCYHSELVSTLENSSLFQKKPEYKKALMVASIPERVIQFRVCICASVAFHSVPSLPCVGCMGE
jgi:glutamate dehydrogenase (NADP+)